MFTSHTLSESISASIGSYFTVDKVNGIIRFDGRVQAMSVAGQSGLQIVITLANNVGKTTDYTIAVSIPVPPKPAFKTAAIQTIEA